MGVACSKHGNMTRNTRLMLEYLSDKTSFKTYIKLHVNRGKRGLVF